MRPDVTPARVVLRRSLLRQMSSYTGGTVARAILDAAHVRGVLVAANPSAVNQYSPINRVISLSLRNYYRSTPEAIAVGAHEAGHAIQHAAGYWLFMVRSTLFPIVRVVAAILPIVLLVAAVFHYPSLLIGALAVYLVMALFHLLTIPIEYDASNRAYMMLIQCSLIEFGSNESKDIQKILRSLLWNYALSFVLAPLWLFAALFKRHS
jgi:uncharacterized protein